MNRVAAAPTLLVLGGTAFIGRAFCQAVLEGGSFRLTLFHRGRTNPQLFPGVPRVLADRDRMESCRRGLQQIPQARDQLGARLQDWAAGAVVDTNQLSPSLISDSDLPPSLSVTRSARPHWNAIVDFSGQSHQHIRNVIDHCDFDHYTFVSSSAVDLAVPHDPYFAMAQNKLWCEHQIASRTDRLLIIRPGFVVGPFDYTDRFFKDQLTWKWRGTDTPVRPLVEVGFLARLMLKLIEQQHTGIVRAGYLLGEGKG